MHRDIVVAEVSLWLDTTGIAEAIVDHMVDEEMPLTVEGAKAVWQDVLATELHDGIRQSVRAKKEKG